MPEKSNELESAIPRVSVIMGVRNCIQYLPQAVNSILHQSFRDFEFIIVDDGSTDGCAEWLAKTARLDCRLKVFFQQHQGLTVSLNKALFLAKGELIARMDADDVSLPQRLQRQVDAFDANDQLVLLGSEVEMVDCEGRWLGNRGHQQDHAQIRLRLLLGDGGALTHPVTMFRTSAAMKVGGYDESFETTQDLDFFLKLSELGGIRNLPCVLLLWRQHVASVNHTKSFSWRAMRRKAVMSTIERIGSQQFVEQLFPNLDDFGSTDILLRHFERAKSNRRFATAWFYCFELIRSRKQRFLAVLRACGLAKVQGAYYLSRIYTRISEAVGLHG